MSEFDRFLTEGQDEFIVVYDELPIVIGFTIDHADALLLECRKDDRQKRRLILKSVREEIGKVSQKIVEGTATDEDLDHMTGDIAIWWMYEYVAGRGEEHVRRGATKDDFIPADELVAEQAVKH